VSRPPRCGRHLRRKKTPPLGKGGGSVHLEIPSAAEGTLLVEMVVDGGVDRDEPLQGSHPPEAEHRPLAPSERQVRIFRPIVEPAAGSLAVTDAEFPQGRAV